MLGSGTAGRRREPATPVAGRMRRRRQFVFFSFFFIQFFLKKILAEFFYLDVHFSFLLFDKFLSVKIFLVIFLSHQFFS